MGTYAIIRQLRLHWTYPFHPIYVAERRRNESTSSVRRVTSRLWFGTTELTLLLIPLLIVVGAICVTVSPWFLPVAGWLVTLLCLGGALFVGYLWPVIIAVRTSTIIVAERELQTWDTLLTTPYAWSDLLIAKMAGALKSPGPTASALFWSLTSLVLIFLTANCKPGTNCPSSRLEFEAYPISVLLGLVLLPLLTGYQVYILAALCGVAVSLLAGTRPIASAVAALITAGMTILSNLLILRISRKITNGDNSPCPQRVALSKRRECARRIILRGRRSDLQASATVRRLLPTEGCQSITREW